MVRLIKDPHAPSEVQRTYGDYDPQKNADSRFKICFLVFTYVVRLQVSNVLVRNCRTTGVQGSPKSLNIVINYAERGKVVYPPCAIYGKLTARQSNVLSLFWDKAVAFGCIIVVDAGCWVGAMRG